MTKIQKKTESSASANEGAVTPAAVKNTGIQQKPAKAQLKSKKGAAPKETEYQAKSGQSASDISPSVNAMPAIEAAPTSAKTTKQEHVLTMLSQVGGVTIDEVMKATGWQQHSVRGFFAGTVRRKLGFELTSDKPEDGERRYAIKVAA